MQTILYIYAAVWALIIVASWVCCVLWGEDGDAISAPFVMAVAAIFWPIAAAYGVVWWIGNKVIKVT